MLESLSAEDHLKYGIVVLNGLYVVHFFDNVLSFKTN